MSPGKRLPEYFANASIDKPIEQIYQDLDLHTGELLSLEAGTAYLRVPVPPLKYDGRFVKGIMITMAADELIEKYGKQITDLFHVVAFSMWCSIAWSKKADGITMCYPNAHREQWFRETYPERKHQILIPLLDTDYTNEHFFRRSPNTERDLDILFVAKPRPEKNAALVGEAFRILNKKYGKPYRMAFAHSYSNKDLEDETKKKRVDAFINAAGEYIDQVELVPWCSPANLISKYYYRAKLGVLATLLEGKNRFIHEMMCCDVPVVAFRAYNQYARGGFDIFPPGAGVYAEEFSAEGLADAMHQALENLDSFTPRKSYLNNFSGREFTINRLIDLFPYYEKALPEYVPGQHFHNHWLNLAVQHTYQCSYFDFTYFREDYHKASNNDVIDKLIKNYNQLLET